MKIHEYQGKELFKKHQIKIPVGIPVFSIEEALKAYETTLLRFPDDAKSAKVRLKIQQLRSTFDATG